MEDPAPAPAPGQPPNIASTGCEKCREQHLKCDRVTPTCGRCRAAVRECIWAGIKIRLDKKRFARKQKWVRIPMRLAFIDETKTVARDALDHDDGEYDEESAQGYPNSTSDESDSRSPFLSINTSQGNRSALVPVSVPASPTDRFIPHDDGGAANRRYSRDAGQQHIAALGSLRSHVYLDEAVWPLTDHSEAVLFRHFVQKLAIWLDLCDPGQSFETIVPQRAGTCPILLNAIFALSARHRSHISDYDPLASNRYHEECLKYLIPVLNHEVTVSDENLFAATIILRVLEEMEVKNMGMDNHGYLLGIHAFVKGGDQYLRPGTLSAASFWIGLRQEIYSAVMNHQPVRINLVNSLVDRSLGPADDYAWANRAVVHCADALNFCFGADSRPAAARWYELDDWNKKWSDSVPASFVPIYQKEGAEDRFPEFWYQSTCQVIGIQHQLLAELFLTCFDPRVPRIGGRRKEAERHMTERIQELVKRICGIALGNHWTPPGMFTACMAIAAFGDHFQKRQDQEAMLDILKQTEEHHARPTEAVQQQVLKRLEMMQAGA